MLYKTYRFRLVFLYSLPFLFLLGLAPKLYMLQVKERARWVAFADNQHNGKQTFVPQRGKILDRNGHEMAGSILLNAAYIKPSAFPEEIEGSARDLAQEISAIINQDYDTVLKRMYDKRADKPDRQVLLARELSEEQADALRAAFFRQQGAVGPNALSFENENKRYYPMGQTAAQVIGFTQRIETGDNLGVAGAEKFFDKSLKGQAEEYRTRTNAAQHALEPIPDEILDATFGDYVKLTIDENIQAATEAALERGVNENRALSGVAVVYGVKTGEVLAMASVPTFSLNNLGAAKDYARRNRAISDSIEPGSCMKILTFLCLFDDNKCEPDDIINCEGGSWAIGNGRTIRDTHGMGSVPVREVFAHSSNIGTIKAARRLEGKQFYKHLLELGFGSRTGIDLPAEVPGKLRPIERWSAMSMGSLPMGYELQVTAIQMAAAVGAVANGGIYMKPHVSKEIMDYSGKTIKTIEPEKIGRIASPVACHKVLEMMESVVVSGTGKTAALENYRVGGKTGTTKKYDPKTKAYTAKNYIASFCGVAPLENPEICVYVYVDDPSAGKSFGGQVAAPIFKEITEAALKTLRVPIAPRVNETTRMEVTLDKIRQRIDGRVPRELLERSFDRDDEASTGTMPELLGLTKREAVTRLALAEIDFEISGSGVVISQDPKPFLPIEPGLKAQIVLGPESKFISRELAAVSETKDNSLPQTTGVATLLGDGDVALRLNSGDASVEIAAKPMEYAQAPLSARRSPRPLATPMPDMDAQAQRTAVPGAGKQAWSQWLKEQARITREDEKAGKGSRREVLVNESETESPDDSSAPADPDFSDVVPDRSADAGGSAIGSAYDLAKSR